MLNELDRLEMQEAESFLYQEIDEEAAEILPDRFKINNLEQANWALRKIRAFKKQMEENEKLAKAEIERIKEWLNKENEKAQKSIQFFEYLIGEYVAEQRGKDSKFKLSTPYGKVTFRKQPAKWNYDEEILLNWLKQNDMKDYIRIKEEVNKAELKKTLKVEGNKAITKEGVIVEGITIEEQPEKLVVEVDINE
ncbi:MAG: host-nuclease inhibitor Gam family protein [Candidatus Aenigmatarchaeota archaeon]